ncbi:hypothetical protein O6H91_20G044300 [Diphasiastrum complanatum]|uniref:Uncharacterized protein n=3 Tax=Diphasiastrum complanatum TaxID=34168 RepID=A0ACC2APU2_DIPCM|nr:hypothetical protein O6H91_Y424100 [Diphasiastrum complanatum]KAJ7249483.1 hypothetical protein O6H91_Y424100 [Diphasiastrum complanatum]KAJ7249485.1 hypothetical protein O6H91_Y424100 [Diphasiastrum complanatum]KAJ7519557.1 hypothetical protein O6H91_20G044300 [Diphasiastrum complanatum]KAJ7519559.1 hypothetical protein O6H91_20G044300 [Diphasiastrum complanatum]
MNEGDSIRASNALARYHSAPSTLLANLTDFREDDLLHIPADPNTRGTQALIASLFSDDFPVAWPQRQLHEVGIPALPTNPHLLQPYPLAVLGESQNPLQSSAQTPCDSMDFSGGSNTICSDNFICATRSWDRRQVQNDHQVLMDTSSCLQTLSPVAVPSSWLPTTPPKTGILRQSSSPATFLSKLSGEFHLEPRLKFSHRMLASLTGSYELQEPCLREESSDEYDEDSSGHSAQQPLSNKRFRSDILHQLGSVSEGNGCVEQQIQIAGNLSLPKKLSEGLLPCNTTPCLARAKRGCATHPRSISERLRRTRISEGIKKLQELVPNMDKQINTADMLDEAVEYIKFLQNQVQELSNNQVIHSEVKRESKP